MESLAATIRRLQSVRQPLGAANDVSTPILPLTEFGTNPGALKGWCYVPEAEAEVPLVVVLHGCTQTAADYDRGSGWSELARQHGFALLFPEQQRANNANLCFNWFVADDIQRDSGEALSIRQMIGAILARHAIDPARVFVTGLSAGGAMTSVMLATCPELFAGGGIIAGLPYGTATSLPQAMQRMRGQGLPDPQDAVQLVRSASGHVGPWPTISVWHGDADTTVVPANAKAIVDQWRTLHHADAAPDRMETIAGHRRRVWRDRQGREAIEYIEVAGMGHGTPLATKGEDGCGVTGPHMLEAGISSTRHLAQRWRLLDGAARQRSAMPARPSAVGKPAPVQATIETALRSAGLLR